MSESPVLRGVVHGKTIELESDAGLPEGLPVSVVVRPLTRSASTGEGFRRSFGGWAEDADELDKYLEWSRRQRKAGRPEIEP